MRNAVGAEIYRRDGGQTIATNLLLTLAHLERPLIYLLFMRRVDIRRGIEEIRSALEKSGVVDIFAIERNTAAEERSERKRTADKPVLVVLKNFAILESNFSVAAREIEQIIGLQQLTDPGIWQHLVSAQEQTVMDHFRRRLAEVNEIMPKFVKLLAQEDQQSFLGSAHQARLGEYEQLTVIAIEEDAGLSRPERLIEVLQGVSELYASCARVQGTSPDELAVLSCDSGSDKSFDLLGLAKVIEQVKEIFIGLWDRVVFYKQKDLSSQLEVIAQGLPILAQVTELESTNRIGPEEAEIIRRGVLSGCAKILSAGVIIPEVEKHATHNPRVLMRPERKLLMAPAAPNTAEQPAAPTEGSHNSDERLSQIEKLLAELKEESAASLPKRRRKRSRTAGNAGDAPPT